MGDDFDFRARRGKSGRRRGHVLPFRRPRPRRKLSDNVPAGILVASSLILGGALGWAVLQSGSALPNWPVASFDSRGIGCNSPHVLDGGTLRCGSVRIRLTSIDAPELPGHCRPGRKCTPGNPYASTDNLRLLVAGQAVDCRQVDTDHYGRAVALRARTRPVMRPSPRRLRSRAVWHAELLN